MLDRLRESLVAAEERQTDAEARYGELQQRLDAGERGEQLEAAIAASIVEKGTAGLHAVKLRHDIEEQQARVRAAEGDL